jgi:hypothetical protein
MLSVPVKQASLTTMEVPPSVAWPAQLVPEDIVNPPSGLHELIVVGGGVGSAGCGCTCKQPAAAASTKTGTIIHAIRDISSPLTLLDQFL